MNSSITDISLFPSEKVNYALALWLWACFSCWKLCKSSSLWSQTHRNFYFNIKILIDLKKNSSRVNRSLWDVCKDNVSANIVIKQLPEKYKLVLYLSEVVFLSFLHQIILLKSHSGPKVAALFHFYWRHVIM